MAPAMEGQKWLWGAQTICTVGAASQSGLVPDRVQPMARHAVTERENVKG